MAEPLTANDITSEGIFTVNRLLPYQDGDVTIMAPCGCGCSKSVSVTVVVERQGIEETSVLVLE